MASIRKIAEGKHQVRWREPIRDANGVPTGKFNQKQETYSDEDQANERLAEINSHLTYGTIDPSTAKAARDKTLSQYAHDYFDSLAGSRKDRTINGYRDVYRVHIAPTLGNRPVATITVSDVTRLRAVLLTTKPHRKSTTRHPKTVKQALGVLQRILTTAKENGGIQSNPADGIAVNMAHAGRFKHTILTPDQIYAVSEHIGNVYGLVILFAGFTGLRREEIQGLEVADLTLSQHVGTDGQVNVNRTKERQKGGIWKLGTTKTYETRVVPIESWLADDLRSYLHNHPNRDDPRAPLFPGRLATARDYNWTQPIDCDNLRVRYFYAALKVLSLPQARFHDLRHSYAVNLLSAGVDFKRVSKWLGHKTLSMTLDIYGDYINPDVLKPAGIARPVASKTDERSNVVSLERRNA